MDLEKCTECTECGNEVIGIESKHPRFVCSVCAVARDTKQARAYRQIAAAIGMEGKPVEEVVERVKELIDDNEYESRINAIARGAIRP